MMSCHTSATLLLRMSVRLTTIGAVCLATAVPSLARQNPPLAISAPATGTVVSPGETVTVTVTSPSGQTFGAIAVLGQEFIGFVGTATALPAQFPITVPATTALRKYRVVATAADGIAEPIFTSIDIAVERPDLPTAIRVDIAQVEFRVQGEEVPITLFASFSDGTVFEATGSTRVTYASSNPNVAEVDAYGNVTAVGAGVSEVTVTYTVGTETRTALVRVIVPPLRYFTVTPNILDFGDQPVGTPVASQMVLTNINATPLSITEVEAVGDFTSSDDCVAASPLAQNAFCTITVTFTPEGTGPRPAMLQVSEAENVTGFRLRGTGIPGDPVSIVSFTPPSGPVGTPVTITGTSFSATPAQNTVTFNGTTATVTAATTTTLQVTVPAGATTGTIGVTSPSGSATSSTPFTVTLPEPPSISSFTPTAGTPGTSVTITGTNFDLVAANNQVRFNTTTAATPSAASATSLTVTVPTNTGSGRIAVTTPAGMATSTGDFIVPHALHTTSDIDSAARLTPAVATTVTVSTATKLALRLFDGVQGQRVSLVGINGVQGQVWPQCDVNVSIRKPDGGVLVNPVCMEGSGFIDATALPSTGTYTVVVDPTDNVTGSVTLTLFMPVDFTSTITPSGPAVSMSLPTPGQNGILTFSGTAGQRVSVGSTNNLTAQILGCDVNVSIVKPDGSTLGSQVCMEGGGFMDPQTLPVTGTYSVFVNPYGHAVGNATVNLYEVTDYTSTITPGGPAVSMSLPTPGQNGILTFSGTAGQRVSLGSTNNLTAQVFGCDVYVSIVKPDGNTLGTQMCMEGGGFMEPQTLPVTGTYSVFVNPQAHAVGNATISLYDVADYTSTITAGSAVTVSMPTQGQNALLTFSGTAGQRVSVLGVNGIFGQVLGCDLNVSIRKPDGNVLGSSACMEGSGFIDTQTLPVTGTYTVFIDPQAYATGNLTVTLYDIVDISSTLTIGGGPVTVTVTMPGQNAALTFSGSSGQQISLAGTNGSIFGQILGCDVNTTIRKPDTTTLAGPTCMEGSGSINNVTLPATGTYTIVVDPSSSATGSLTLTLTGS